MSLKITILVDNPDSWIIPFAQELQMKLLKMEHEVNLVHKHKEVTEGDILVLLSCTRVFQSLDLNKYNLVVHESDLPKGRGMSPFTWQILEGKSKVPVTLIEATKELDSGVIYGQEWVHLKGDELVDEWRSKQGNSSIELIVSFVNNYPEVNSVEQKGDPTFYPKRSSEDSKLDIHKSINEQFNLLRVVDNERYPAWFEKDGVKYKLTIKKMKE